MTGKRRIAYLDIARGIGMILVVIGHVEYVNPTVRQFISAFHMPLFFLISGILVWERQEEEKSFTDLIKRKLRSIMLPYAVFSVLSFVVEGSRIALKGLDEWDVVFRQLYQSLCLQGVSTLWFLSALFMSELLFLGIRKTMNHGWTITMTTVIVMLTALLSVWEKEVYLLHENRLAWGLLHDFLSMLLRNLFCVGFVGIGYYSGKYILPMLNKVWVSFLAVLILGILTCLVIPMNWGVDLRYMNLGNVPLFLLGAVAGTMTVLLVSRLIEGVGGLRYVLQYYGRNSLIVMVTHMDFRVLYCSIRLTTLIQPLREENVLFCGCVIILVFLLEIPMIWFLNRFFPVILGKRSKIS